MSGRLIRGNHITLLETGGDYFPALVAAIDAARQEVLLETYIFEDDDTGRRVAAALCAAAARGLRVRLMVDGFGSRSFVEGKLHELEATGVEVMVFRREIATFAFRRHRLRRLHRKLSVVDRRIGFVGGINIIDDMNTPRQTPPRFDYAVAIEGPLVGRIHATMSELWQIVRWASFRRRPRETFAQWARPQPQPPQPRIPRRGEIRASLVLRDNLRHRNDIERAYLAALRHAGDEVIIANAYFFPGRRFRKALTDAVERGVKVTLLLQGKVEYWLLHHACRALYPHLLNSGVRIMEYRKSFLHAKVAVIDDDWATVGSSNIDPFSLMLAREANVVVRDQHFAHQLRASLLRAMDDGAVELDAREWQRRPLPQRLLSWLAYGLMRLAIGLAGYGQRLR